MRQLRRGAILAALWAVVVCPGRAGAWPVQSRVLATYESDQGGVFGLAYGPDDRLWTFRHSIVGAIDSVDGVFFNGDDVYTTSVGPGGMGNAFDPNGYLVSFDKYGSATSRDPVDGVFFNGDDVVTNFELPIESFHHGSGEPIGATFDANGNLYAVSRINHTGGLPLAVFTPTDGQNIANGSTVQGIGLADDDDIQGPWGLAFNEAGNLFLPDIHYGPHFTRVDPVDGVFGNGDDEHLDFVTALTTTDLSFDPFGNMFLATGGDTVYYLADPDKVAFPGDYDEDGDRDDDDLGILQANLTGPGVPAYWEYDLDWDDDADDDDVYQMVRTHMGIDPGDFDHDGDQEEDDLATLLANLTGSGSPAYWEYDLDADGDADEDDVFDMVRDRMGIAPGDLNRDGLLDADDIDLLWAGPGGPIPPTFGEFDLNADGAFDGEDVDLLVLDLMGSTYGDFNLDSIVNASDLMIMQTGFGAAGGWASGDMNGDYRVDATDLMLLADSGFFILGSFFVAVTKGFSRNKFGWPRQRQLRASRCAAYSVPPPTRVS